VEKPKKPRRQDFDSGGFDSAMDFYQLQMRLWRESSGSSGRSSRGGDQHRARMLGGIARRAYDRAAAQQGRNLQYIDSDCRVTVKMGYSSDHGCYTTDILVIPRKNNPRGSEQHVVFGPDGQELYNEWREK
jgi:hypothetical protein